MAAFGRLRGGGAGGCRPALRGVSVCEGANWQGVGGCEGRCAAGAAFLSSLG